MHLTYSQCRFSKSLFSRFKKSQSSVQERVKNAADHTRLHLRTVKLRLTGALVWGGGGGGGGADAMRRSVYASVHGLQLLDEG